MKPVYLRYFCDLYWSQQLLAPGDGESLCDRPEAFGNPYNNPQRERGGNWGVEVSMIPAKVLKWVGLCLNSGLPMTLGRYDFGQVS